MAFNFEAFFDWSENIDTRKQSLARFAQSAGAGIQYGCAAWGDGLYLLLHFDLLSVDASGNQIDRSNIYKKLADSVQSNRGTRLGGSVYIVPLIPLMRSERCAARFWNVMRNALSGILIPGDSFYLHYAPDVRNLMGGIAEVVPIGSNSLTPAQEPNN